MLSRSLDYPTSEDIAVRAYDLWERNGRPEGTADSDWLQAETELKAEIRVDIIEEQHDLTRVATG